MPEPSFDERVSIVSLSDNITKYIETDIHKWVFQVKKIANLWVVFLSGTLV